MTGRGRWARLGAVLVAAVALVACANDDTSPEPATPLTASELSSARDQLVAADALPQLTTEARDLDLQDLVDEADTAGVAEQLRASGFRGAVERTFRGRAQEITGAESRVLVFASSAGAAGYAEYLADEPDPFFGGPSLVTQFRAGGAEGALIEPPLCDCPGAHPLYVGVVAEADRVLWLQLTGPKANPARLRALLSAAAHS